ncbi:hypothetical protein [Vibrio eleionomae]|nr:hypothetical protein [Vibrio eleionomae]
MFAFPNSNKHRLPGKLIANNGNSVIADFDGLRMVQAQGGLFQTVGIVK